MKFLYRILVVCIFAAAAALNGTDVAADNFQKAKRAHVAYKDAIAVKLLLPLAKAGDARAQNLLGNILYLANGETGIKGNKAKAKYWYEKAVKQNYTPALGSLGLLLIQTRIDTKRGYRLLKTAAERGNDQAQWMLGRYQMTPDRPDRGVPYDRAAARKWLLKAIEQKYTYAALDLMEWYQGEGDYTEAHKWDLVVQHLWKAKSTFRLPDIREKMTKIQIAESQRRAAAWLKAHGEKP